MNTVKAFLKYVDVEVQHSNQANALQCKARSYIAQHTQTVLGHFERRITSLKFNFVFSKTWAGILSQYMVTKVFGSLPTNVDYLHINKLLKNVN